MGGEYFNYAEARILELEAQVKEAGGVMRQLELMLAWGNEIDSDLLDGMIAAYRSHYPGGE